MSTKIFVGNLSYGVTNDTIRPLFENYGVVTECDVLVNFGFVHMENEEEAKQAIADLDGYEVHGAKIKVEMSTVATQGKKRNLRSATKIFIGNLRNGTTNEQLREIFARHGNVTEADVVGGYGFVHMDDEREALQAIRAVNGSKLNGNTLNVELSTKATQGKARGQDGFGPTERCISGSMPNITDWQASMTQTVARSLVGGIPPKGHSNSFRGRGGTAWGSRGRGRGGASSRFDPYSAPSGPSWLPRSEVYPAIPVQGVDTYHLPSFRAGSLPAPPSARMVPAAAPATDDTSFARELLQLYSKDPAAFDAYARNPDVRRSLNLVSEPAAAPAAVLRPRDDPYHLKTPREYIIEQRLQQSAMLTPAPAAARNISAAPLYMSFE